MTAVDRFATNMQALIEVLRDIVADACRDGFRMVDPALIDMAGLLLRTADKNKAIETFIERSYQSWDQLRNRDFDYFANNATTIFEDLPDDKVDAFRQLFAGTDPKTGEPIIKEDDRNALFDFFHAKVKISLAHIAEVRKKGNTSYFSYINVEQQAAKWGAKLS